MWPHPSQIVLFQPFLGNPQTLPYEPITFLTLRDCHISLSRALPSVSYSITVDFLSMQHLLRLNFSNTDVCFLPTHINSCISGFSFSLWSLLYHYIFLLHVTQLSYYNLGKEMKSVLFSVILLLTGTFYFVLHACGKINL